MSESTAIATQDEKPQTMLAMIERFARDPAVDVNKLQALLNMQERLMANQARAEFNEAFARLQQKLPRITKKGEVRYPTEKNNPRSATKKAFNYARWEDIDELIRPLLNEEGFSLSWDSVPHASGGIVVIGKLRHSGGHEQIASIGPLPLDTSGGKNNLQAAGSTFSYAKRYTAQMLLNLTYEGEDDDGVAGGLQPISADQVKQISDLLTETKGNLDAFCTLMDVETLPDITVEKYPVAINALMARRRKVETAP